MILIKDRHLDTQGFKCKSDIGKYDTYKGSTPWLIWTSIKSSSGGNYDTYKGSTHLVRSGVISSRSGNYDTYKGSTQIWPTIISTPNKEIMILIKDYVFGVICFWFELLLFDWLKRTSDDVLFNLFSFRLINLNCLTYKKWRRG